MTQQFSTYVVKAGDSLGAIAKELLGDANRWKEIWEANKEAVLNPNAISVGQELLIPVMSTEGKAAGQVRDRQRQAE